MTSVVRRGEPGRRIHRRYRIVPTRVERVTTGNALDSQPASTPRTVTTNGLIAVLGTRGIEATGGRQHPR